MSAGHAIPCISNCVLYVLPGRRSAMLVAVPVACQVGLDIIPAAVLVAVRRFVTVPIARAIEVVVASCGVRPVAVVGPPVRILLVPCEFLPPNVFKSDL